MLLFDIALSLIALLLMVLPDELPPDMPLELMLLLDIEFGDMALLDEPSLIELPDVELPDPDWELMLLLDIEFDDMALLDEPSLIELPDVELPDPDFELMLLLDIEFEDTVLLDVALLALLLPFPQPDRPMVNSVAAANRITSFIFDASIGKPGITEVKCTCYPACASIRLTMVNAETDRSLNSQR